MSLLRDELLVALLCSEFFSGSARWLGVGVGIFVSVVGEVFFFRLVVKFYDTHGGFVEIVVGIVKGGRTWKCLIFNSLALTASFYFYYMQFTECS